MFLGVTVLNVVCRIVFNHRYDINDAEFRDIILYNSLLTQGFSGGDPIAFLPWLRFFPFKSIKLIREYIRIRDPIIDRKLQEHRDTFDPNNLRDLTDALIQLSSEAVTLERANLKHLSDDHLTMVINDIFTAGTETTVTTLRWATVYLLRWPDEQQKLYDELIGVIGEDRYPALADRGELDYLEATIRETLRLSSLLPLGLPHKCISDSSINEIDIPKNTQVLFNTWQMHRDPQFWDDAEVFNPGRWLSPEAKLIAGANLSYLPFSAGRRVCLGESLAKTELFIILSRLIRDFIIKPESGKPVPGMDATIGITLAPFDFKVVFEARPNSLSLD